MEVSQNVGDAGLVFEAPDAVDNRVDLPFLQESLSTVAQFTPVFFVR